MAQRAQSRGTCTFCGQAFAKGAMARHLGSCKERHAAIWKADSGGGRREALYHLRVRDAYPGDFWLDLEVSGTVTLEKIDRYLRAIWLECCGHLSKFSIGGWGGRDIGKARKVAEVFEPGAEVTHIYDFGTVSVTLISAAGVREGVPLTRHPIFLMARNLIPESKCIECGEPAEYLCRECQIEEEVWGTLCAAHAKTHPHEEYGEPVALVNSPRMGLCGYEGPADPPY